jgi:hypothetical protein
VMSSEHFGIYHGTTLLVSVLNRAKNANEHFACKQGRAVILLGWLS